MFSSQIIRVLRDRWRNATELSQELYALFASDRIPLDHKGPLTLTNEAGTQAPLTLKQFGDGPFIKFEGPNGEELGAIEDDGEGGITGGGGGGGGSGDGSDGAEQQVFAGKVLSGGGTSYTCDLYPDGPDAAASSSVTVRVLQLDDDLPADSWLIVIKTGDVYCAQPAIFYAPGA